MRLSVTLCTLFLLVCVSLNSAQVFRFNGQFNDPSGQSVGGTVFVSSVMVQLFDSPVVGQSGYIQMEPSVQVVDGLFSLDIGPGLPDLNQYRYLELTISGETLSPRVPILVAPLSLQSMDSERFGKLTTDEFLQIVGNAILEESNFITDSLTTGLSILSNDIVNNSQQIGSLDGRLNTVEQNAGSNAALQAVSQSLQSQDLRLQDLELVVGDSQSQLQALSSQLGTLGSEQALQSADLSSVQSDVLVLDSSLAQLQTTVSFLQGNLSQTPLDVLTSGEGSFSTSTVLHFEGSDMQLVIHSVLTDENAADKIVLFDSDGLEAFRVNAGGEVTAVGYYGDGSGLSNLHSSQITDFVSAVQGVSGGVLFSSDVSDFSTAVDGQIQSALVGASFDSSQISDFETAVDARLLLNPMSSLDITDFETAVLAQSPNLVLTSGQVLDLSTAIDIQLGLTNLNSAQISDLQTAVQTEVGLASFDSSQITDFQTATESVLSGSYINSYQVSDFETAVDSRIGIANLVTSQISDFATEVDNKIGAATINSSQISDFSTAVDSRIIGASLSAAQISDFDSSVDSRLSGANFSASQITDFDTAASGAVVITKEDVLLGNVDNVQQIPMTYLETTLTNDSNLQVPSSQAVAQYVASELSGLDNTYVGLGSVQNIDVTTDFDQNPAGSIGTHKIRGIDNQGLLLLNQQFKGARIFDASGHMSINTDADLGGLTIHGNTDEGHYGALVIEEATDYADVYIEMSNTSPSGRGYLIGLAAPNAGDYSNKFYIEDDYEGETRLIFDSQGYAGIMTSSPQATLDVSGTLRLGTTDIDGPDGTLRWNGSDLEVKMGGSWTSILGGGGSSVFTDNTTNAVYDGGFLGLGAGANDPDEQLLVDGRLRLLSDTDDAGQDGTIRWTGSDLEVKNAGQWYSLTASGGSTGAGGVSTNPFEDYALIRDVKASGNHGGISVSGWNTRDLNTIERDDSGMVTLTGNAFTLQPGHYLIEASAPAKQIGAHVLALYDSTNSTFVHTGPNNKMATNAGVSTRASFSVPISITATTSFEIWHHLEVGANTTQDLGQSNVIAGADEIFTEVHIWDEGEDEGSGGGGSGGYFVTSGGDTNLSGGYLGLNEPSPAEMLDVNGRIRLQSNTDNSGNDGTLRWNGADLEVKKAGDWVSLTSGGNSTGASTGGGLENGLAVLSTNINPPSGYQYSGDSISSKSATKGNWETHTGMNTARRGFAAAELNGEYYVAGGDNSSNSTISSVEKYDPATDSWTGIAAMNSNRRAAGMVEYNGQLYIFGGHDGVSYLASAEKYDPSTNSWITLTPMTVARQEVRAAVVGNYIYVIGGYEGTYQGTVERFDPVANSWSSMASMSNGRQSLGVAAVNGLIYAIGGSDGSELSTVEIYDPAQDSWTAGTSPSNPFNSYAIIKYQNRIFCFGGTFGDTAGEVYDTLTDSWSTVQGRPIGFYGAEGVAIGNKFFLAGGWDGSTTYSELNVYVPEQEYFVHTSDGTGSGGSSAGSNFADSGPNTTLTTGFLGINEPSPVEALDVAGRMRLQTTTGDAGQDGTIRWTGSDLEVKNAGSWLSLTSGVNTTNTSFSAIDYALVLDERASGSLSGSAAAGTWNIRTLNTIKSDENGIVKSLSGNIVTLDPGTYKIRAMSHGLFIDQHRLRLYDTTAATPVATGNSGFSAFSTGEFNTVEVNTYQTFATTATIRLEHYATTAQGSNAFGQANSIAGSPEVFAYFEIWKFNDFNAAVAQAAGESTEIKDADNDTLIDTASGGDSDKIIFQTDGTLGMVITSDNRVGIGTDQTQGGTLTIQSQSTHTNILMNTTQPNYITGFDLYNGNAPKWALHSRGTADGANLDDRFSIQNGSASEVMTFRQTGSVGIGTNTPKYHLDIRHPSGYTLARIDTVSGSNLSALFFSTGGNDDWHISARGAADAPTGRLSIYDQSNYETMTFLQGGNVGIGTNNPAEQLHIKNASGNSQVSIEGGAGAFASTLEFKNNGASKWLLQSRGTIDGPNDRFTIHNAGAASQVFTILQTGAVGIGTSTPNEKLHVNGNSLTTGYSMFGDSLFFADTSIHADPILAFDAADYIQFDRATDKFFFNINNTERFTILNNGNVGVGVSNPTTALEVAGGTLVQGGLNVGLVGSTADGNIYLGDASSYWRNTGDGTPHIAWDGNDYFGYERGSDNFFWRSGGVERMRLDSNGRMGINTSNNYAKMVIDKESEAIPTLALVAQPGIWNNLEFRHGGVTQWHLSSRSTQDTPYDRLSIYNAGVTELFTILQSGNVGIGNNDPDNKLTVNGDIRIGTGGTNGCLRRADTTVLVGTCASDERFKKSIESYSDSLSRLTKLRPVSYFWRSDEFPEKSFGKEKSSGFIAQEMEKVFPELVSTTEDGFKAVNYGIELRMHTIQAIKELNEKLEEELAEKDQLIQGQQREIETLRETQKDQAATLEDLKKQVNFLLQNQK